ncbi:SOS response-associated peptidase [Aeromicrobium sp. CTD01-1L150]|uniref:SOS response-associated peptidase n=1 Tax=Aeromicrobium sp. CTD01-1L150 TaxID=3341830 RepID=UPI0035BF4A73
MCGRYASTRSRGDLLKDFEILDEATDDRSVEPDYNVAPTKEAPVVLSRPPRDAKDADPVRQLRHLTWGLVPSWSKEAKLGRMINARAETVHELASFRKPFRSRRAIVPIAGFYEWIPTQKKTPSGRKQKQPFYLHPKVGQTLPLAGLYEFWRDKTRADDDLDRWLTTFTIITTEATDDVGHVHDRMPMTIDPEHWEAWLDPHNDDVDAVRALMAPPLPGSLEIYPVSTLVSNVRNNGPELLEPLPVEPKAGD